MPVGSGVAVDVLVSVTVGIGVAVDVLVSVTVGIAVAVTVLAAGVGLATGVQAVRTNKQTSVSSFACDLILPPSIPVTGFPKAPNGLVQPLELRWASRD